MSTNYFTGQSASTASDEWRRESEKHWKPTEAEQRQEWAATHLERGPSLSDNPTAAELKRFRAWDADWLNRLHRTLERNKR